jgi:NAD-dependent dihydropyrimidine dehydrogenase PreA subunit
MHRESRRDLAIRACKLLLIPAFIPVMKALGQTGAGQSSPSTKKNDQTGKPTSKKLHSSDCSFPTYVIAAPCIGTKDTACVDACPVDAIHPTKAEKHCKNSPQLYIDPVECINCGACVPACPVSAIFASDDLPSKWASFCEVNAKYFKKKNPQDAHGPT